MMTRYAQNTSVSIERSKAEVERLLHRYGADEVMSAMSRDGRALIGFMMDGLMVKIQLSLPSMDDPRFWETDTGRSRKAAAAEKSWEQECRAQWRSLVLVVKAKLEAIEAGISTFEREFLPDVVFRPDGTTLGQALLPTIQKVVSSGKLPALIPAVTG